MGIRKELQGKIRDSLEKNWEQFYEEFGKNTMLSEFKRYNKIRETICIFALSVRKKYSKTSEQQDIPRYTAVLV